MSLYSVRAWRPCRPGFICVTLELQVVINFLKYDMFRPFPVVSCRMSSYRPEMLVGISVNASASSKHGNNDKKIHIYRMN